MSEDLAAVQAWMAEWASDMGRIRLQARSYRERGVTVAAIREVAAAEPFFMAIADEMAVLEARSRFRVIRGGLSRHPLAVRIASIAEHPEPRPALAAVPARRQRRQRG